MAGLSFDSALEKYVGQFGRYQIRLLLIVSLIWIPNALLILTMVFFASPNPIQQGWWKCNDQNDEACAKAYADRDDPSSVCGLDSGAWAWTGKSRSIVSQFGLTCGKQVLTQLASSGFFAGYLIGSGIFGGLSDARGRKPVLFGCTMLGSLAMVLVGLSPNYAMYFIFRLVTGIGAAGQALTIYILATESVGPKFRGFAGVATQLFFIAGEFVLVLVAYLFKGWRNLSFATAALNGVVLLLWPIIPESPRWLLVKGETAKAMQGLKRMAAVNGTTVPTEALATSSASAPAPAPAPQPAPAGAASNSQHTGPAHNGHDQEESMPLNHHQHGSAGAAAAAGGGTGAGHQQAQAAQVQQQPAAPQQKVGLLQVLKDKHILRRFLVLGYVWCILCMTYYGISLALGGIPGSIYITFMITAIAEFPSYIVAAVMIERYGRHNTMAAGMLLGGASCLVCGFLPAGMGQAVLAAIGKFGCAGAFTIASIFTSEMFPTLVRSAVLGAENEFARIGGIAAPFIVLAGQTTGKPAMPYSIFGVASLVAGVLIFTLPETLGTTTPDTMEDMGGIASIFTTRPWSKGGGWRGTASELFKTRATPQGAAAAAAAGAAKAQPGPGGVQLGAAAPAQLPTVVEEEGGAEGGSPRAHDEHDGLLSRTISRSHH